MNHHKIVKKEIVFVATVLIFTAAISRTIVGNNAFAKNPQTTSPIKPCGNKLN